MNGIGKLDHIDIVVEDVARTRDFMLAMGFQFLRETDHGGGAVELRFPGGPEQPVLELTPAQAGDGTSLPLGLRHLALSVNDLEAAARQLSQNGYRVDSPRQIQATNRKIANVSDPDGGVLQLVENAK